MSQGRRVFVDTMVVFTAFELGCWKLLANAYRIETVSAVVSETQTGDPLNPRRVPVPLPELKAGLAAVHTPSKRDLATFATGHPRLLTLDRASGTFSHG